MFSMNSRGARGPIAPTGSDVDQASSTSSPGLGLSCARSPVSLVLPSRCGLSHGLRRNADRALVAAGVKPENPTFLGTSASKQDLHLGIVLAHIDRADDTGDHPSLEATYPHVNSVAVARSEVREIAVIERI